MSSFTQAPADAGRIALDGNVVKADFPILTQPPRNRKQPLVFLDSAASSQKPQAVIDALGHYYTHLNANIHRGVYDLSEAATDAYEQARRKVSLFINAKSPRECIMVRNTTEAINLVARAWGSEHLVEGDLIVFTEMEHHSNIVPWHILAEEKGLRQAHVRIDGEGRLDLDEYAEILRQEPKLVAFTHVSNSLGTVNPARQMIADAHAAGAITVVDAAQSAPHLPIDVQDLDVDFMAVSGHKMLGPMGSGVLYGKKVLLDNMPPYMGGGSMIRKVFLDHTTWADVPARFEAGTPSVGDTFGLGAAVDYLNGLGMHRVWAHERDVVAYALQALQDLPDIRIFGPKDAQARSGVVSFALGSLHPHDVAEVLNEQNVAVRAGHHCTQPLMKALGVTATTRASFYLYNTPEDVDRLVEALHEAQRVFSGAPSATIAAARKDEPCRKDWDARHFDG
jgi:cysteine desulfurase / selenocysteine lyase